MDRVIARCFFNLYEIKLKEKNPHRDICKTKLACVVAIPCKLITPGIEKNRF